MRLSLLSLLLLVACNTTSPTTPRRPAGDPAGDAAAEQFIKDALAVIEAFNNGSLIPEPEALPDGETEPAPRPSARPTPRPGASAAPNPEPTSPPRVCLDPSLSVADDADRDGLHDGCEQDLAERFAPVIYHSSSEDRWPINVDWYLSRSALAIADPRCDKNRRERLVPQPTQAQLIAAQEPACGEDEGTLLKSAGTRSRNKEQTFYLEDVPSALRNGSTTPSDWRTYVQAYPNEIGGVTLQYWRLYAYHRDDLLNNYGGEWVGFHVVLNHHEQPQQLILLNDKFEPQPWEQVQLEDERPVLFVKPGSHNLQLKPDKIGAKGCGSFLGLGCNLDVAKPATHVRQETHTDGAIRWFDGQESPSAGLIQVGRKEHPLNGQDFIAYSGLWGSLGRLYNTSGFWGPAFHHVARRPDGGITAWGAGWRGIPQSELFPWAESP